ncbi:PTS sugar transporter subunit IIC [Streptococcus alactolyticus]|uniref:PTS sugar transporter subunit IIC n=1 Tax=Streptococcus alactolyticus TaxID=29389 RepID=UPI0037520C1B
MAIPTALCVLFGEQIVTLILNYVPDWVTTGLTVAGNMLPVVGIALLLQVMPAKKYLSLLLIGFVLTAYLSLPIVGVFIIGLALAYYYFTITTQKVATTSANTVEDMGDDFDE